MRDGDSRARLEGDQGCAAGSTRTRRHDIGRAYRFQGVARTAPRPLHPAELALEELQSGALELTRGHRTHVVATGDLDEPCRGNYLDQLRGAAGELVVVSDHDEHPRVDRPEPA